MATVSRSDITLEEERYPETLTEYSVYWTARLDGRTSSGETVQMSRTANHAGEALALLEEALEKEGWTVR